MKLLFFITPLALGFSNLKQCISSRSQVLWFDMWNQTHGEIIEAAAPIARHLCCFEQVLTRPRSISFIEDYLFEIEADVKTNDQLKVYCFGLSTIQQNKAFDGQLAPQAVKRITSKMCETA